MDDVRKKEEGREEGRSGRQKDRAEQKRFIPEQCAAVPRWIRTGHMVSNYERHRKQNNQ